VLNQLLKKVSVSFVGLVAHQHVRLFAPICYWRKAKHPVKFLYRV